MKYLRMREVATSSRKENFPQCSICGEKKIGMWLTVDYVRVCHECKSNDTEAEFLDRER